VQHQTLYADADGVLRDMDCPCGEDHGPSVDEERRRLLQENERLRARVADLDAEQSVAWHRVAELETAVRCTCDYAGMEGEQHRDFCEIEGGPHVECRDRIRELEKQRERDVEDLAMYERWAKDSPVKEVDCSCGVRHAVRIADANLNTSTGTEWGVRWPDGEVEHDGREHDGRVGCGGEAYARRVHALYPRETELVQRTLGPWRKAT
jgi:hypothetical protein